MEHALSGNIGPKIGVSRFCPSHDPPVQPIAGAQLGSIRERRAGSEGAADRPSKTVKAAARTEFIVRSPPMRSRQGT
jgi:hypothetical protein